MRPRQLIMRNRQFLRAVLRDGTSRALRHRDDETHNRKTVAEDGAEFGGRCRSITISIRISEILDSLDAARDFLFFGRDDARLREHFCARASRGRDGESSTRQREPFPRPDATISGDRHGQFKHERHLVCGWRSRRKRDRGTNFAERFVHGAEWIAYCSERHNCSVK